MSSGSPSSSAPSAPANRLAASTSPYLLQHAHNPVDWFPWGPEAFEKSRAENKPIFLSIGYSACHWCHVMEREVFEKPAMADIMNAHFVNIKVDREERPDVDELYMLATQLMTGAGGWPMSVWLTPDLKPFYAGTYFPPEDGYGRPGFPRLELALADAWKNRRAELIAQADRVADGIRTHADESASASAGTLTLALALQASLEQSADRFDETNGGTLGAPKFPPHQALALWLAMLRHPRDAALSPDDIAALQPMVTRTLDGMMNGGLYDHVGGAFARYSTDERWLVPHFEKMLYDNAQLAPVYALASLQFNRPDYARIARGTLDFWLREMTSPKGAFFATLDADSEGAEGKFYVWTPADVLAALGNDDDAALIREHFGLTDQGNWHESPVDHASVLAVAVPCDTLSARHNVPLEEMRKRLDALLVRMRIYRAQRTPPGLDDKILTSWNGLMISAMAICGRVLREPRYLEAAHRAMGFLLTQHMEGGRRLFRVSRHAETGTPPHTPAFLEDHAFLLNGLMDLIDATVPTSLPGTMARKRALELGDVMIKEFEDPDRGGFFFTSRRHEQLFARMKNAADNATPSANGVAIRALLRLAHESGRESYRTSADRALKAFAGNIARRPDFFPTTLLALLEDAHAATHRLGIVEPDPLPPRMDAPDSAPPASGILSLRVDPPAPISPGNTFTLTVHITISPAYHIQPHVPHDKEAFATVARIRGDAPLSKQEWSYPDSAGAAAYESDVTLSAACTLSKTAPPGRHRMRVTLLAQPCSATACLPPEKVSSEFFLEVR